MNEEDIKQYAQNEATTIINRIIELRKLKKLTQEQLAERAGISTNSVGQIERGIIKISLVTFTALLKALNISYKDFFDGMENSSTASFTSSDYLEYLLKQVDQHKNRNEFIEIIEILLKTK
ncbi:XRE family transcriptional regulator [Enterococcus faecalis]|nr:XRE family transcriptional regulator [Enterococcus faecalis]